jgi:hypothetical protein
VPETPSHALAPRPGPNGLEPVAPPAFPAAPLGRPEIAKALAAAQQRCQPVPKDERNEYHRYNYASSEAIIAEAKAALSSSGLALLPVEQSLVGSQREGEDRFELERKFLLLHASGECLPLVSHWPVCPEKGRPLDKACAIAATLSLAYLLRDLLLMPRVDADDEVGSRDDRKAGPARAAPPKQPAGPKAAPKDGAELADRLAAWEKSLADARVCKAGDLLSHVRNAGAVIGREGDVASWDAAGVAAGWQAAAEYDRDAWRRAINQARQEAKPPRAWPEVMRGLKLPPDTAPDALTRAERQEALRLLREEAPAAAREGSARA